MAKIRRTLIHLFNSSIVDLENIPKPIYHKLKVMSGNSIITGLPLLPQACVLLIEFILIIQESTSRTKVVTFFCTVKKKKREMKQFYCLPY